MRVELRLHRQEMAAADREIRPVGVDRDDAVEELAQDFPTKKAKMVITYSAQGRSQ